MAGRERSIIKTVTKTRLSEQDSDYRFWQTQSYEKRLEALEQLRQEYAPWKYDSQPRFQRVFSIIKRQ